MPRDFTREQEIGVQPQVPALLPIGHQRLLRLAEFLATVPRKRFDMGKWVCGTTACAAGWAHNIPEFREAGYRLNWAVGPMFNDERGFRALRLFFELKNAFESEHLFGCNHVRTPDEEARIIREFVAARRSA